MHGIKIDYHKAVELRMLLRMLSHNQEQPILGMINEAMDYLWGALFFTRDDTETSQNNTQNASCGAHLQPLNDNERNLAKTNRNIDAVKAYRERCSSGLVAAKDAVWAYQASLPYAHPAHRQGFCSKCGKNRHDNR